ncbi:MAG TPA: hypothetical protein VGB45_16325 [Abditibacterium sp.]|jgi:hypothetical protein
MLLHFPLFIDPRYNAEQDVQFDSGEVESIEETTRSRIFAGSFKVTRVRLSGNREYLLSGHFAAQIEAARRSAVETTENTA